MRIPDRILTDSIRASLGLNTARLAKVEKEISTGRRINAPSDDPAGAATALRLRTDVSTSEQYARTVDAASSRLSAADTALGSLTDALQRARELAVQAGDGSLGPGQLQALGTEVNQILLHAVQIGNTNFGGQYIFAGTKTTTTPFAAAGAAPPTVTYNGNANPIALDVGQGAQVQVDVPGAATFMPAMSALVQIRDALNAGDAAAVAAAGLPALDSAIDTALETRGTLGARVNRLESLSIRMEDERTNLQSLTSQIEDIDITDTIVRLNSARNVYEASLGAAAKAIQPTLVDFLR